MRVAAPSGEVGGKRAGGGFLAAPVEKTVSGLPGMTLEGPGCLRMGRGYQEGSVQCPQPQFAVCDVSRQALHSLRGGF